MTGSPAARAAASNAFNGSTAADSSLTSFPSCAEAAGLEEVALHVDDDQRGRRHVERERVRPRRDELRHRSHRPDSLETAVANHARAAPRSARGRSSLADGTTQDGRAGLARHGAVMGVSLRVVGEQRLEGPRSAWGCGTFWPEMAARKLRRF